MNVLVFKLVQEILVTLLFVRHWIKHFFVYISAQTPLFVLYTPSFCIMQQDLYRSYQTWLPIYSCTSTSLRDSTVFFAPLAETSPKCHLTMARKKRGQSWKQSAVMVTGDLSFWVSYEHIYSVTLFWKIWAIQELPKRSGMRQAIFDHQTLPVVLTNVTFPLARVLFNPPMSFSNQKS